MTMRFFFISSIIIVLLISHIETGESAGDSVLRGESVEEELSYKDCSGCHDGVYRERFDYNKNPECFECHKPGHIIPGKPGTGGKPHPHPIQSSKQGDGAATSRVAAAKTDKRDMAYIPAGEFIMGTNDRHDDEGPEHRVNLDAFYIDIYELSNTKYKIFVDATNTPPPFHFKNGKIPKGKENHPVVYVSWYDADAYCKWANKRLPTEQEWEKAGRSADGRIFPWGNIFDPNKSNNPQKVSKGTEPVDSYEKGRNPYGIYNLSGNVWEWTSSYYLPHPGNTIPNENYGESKRLLKGGSWFNCLTYACGISAPLYNRSYFVPEVKNHSFGFRCVKDAVTVHPPQSRKGRKGKIE